MRPLRPLRPAPTGTRAARGGRRLRGLDLSPLRESRDFRLLLGSGIITILGTMVTYVAVPLQVTELTGSFAAVGLLGVCELVPLLLLAMWGGALADFVDRRRMLIGCEVAAMAASGLLWLNARANEPRVWPIFALVAVLAGIDALQRPSLDSLVPRVVRHDKIPAASSLFVVRWQVGAVAGPAFGGWLVVTHGAQWAYLIDFASYAASLVFLVRLRQSPPPEGAERPSVRRIGEGLAYARQRPHLLGTYIVDFAAMATAMPTSLLPFLAEDLGSKKAVGVLYAAPFAGSVVASLTSRWIDTVHHHGRFVVWGAIGWGVGVAGLGMAPTVWVAALALGFAGFADMISGLFRGIMWNQTIPDDLRGRLAGVEMISYSTGPQVGQMRGGAVASIADSARVAVVSGGVACIAAVGLLRFVLPAFWRYDVRTNPDADLVRRQREATADGAP